MGGRPTCGHQLGEDWIDSGTRCLTRSSPSVTHGKNITSQQKLGDLAVRVTVVGRASPRWKGARNATEAERLNQRLSEMRAQNVRRAVEEILRNELPRLPIEVPAKGVGSQKRFPSVSEDNAAVDRSVLVTVELTTMRAGYKFQPHGPRRIYVPSKIWTLKVISMAKAGVAGYVRIFLRVALRNPYSGKEITLSGELSGGGATVSVKDSFQIKKEKPTVEKVGSEAAFLTPEALDFDDFSSVVVRMGKLEISPPFIKAGMTYLTLVGLHAEPDMLIFDLGLKIREGDKLKVDKLKADAFLVFGTLRREGPNPGDFLELPSYPDIIPTSSTSKLNNGLILCFPIEKSDLHDLTQQDRQRLEEFVTNKARAIATLSESFNAYAPRR